MLVCGNGGSRSQMRRRVFVGDASPHAFANALARTEDGSAVPVSIVVYLILLKYRLRYENRLFSLGLVYHHTYSSSPKNTFTGSHASPHTLNRSGRLLNCFISSSDRLHPSSWRLDSIRDAVTDFGMTAVVWSAQCSTPLLAFLTYMFHAGAPTSD